jgi:HAMP domain-containing protein
MRRLVLLTATTVLALAGGSVSPVRAGATPLDDAVAALRSSAVYVGASTPKIDRTRVEGDLHGVKVAILPTGGPDPVTEARTIGGRLDPNGKRLTVVVFAGRSYGAASSARCGVGSAINEAVGRHRAQLQSSGDVTDTVRDFAGAVPGLPSAAGGCGSASSGQFGDSGRDSGGSGHTGLIVFLVVAVLLVGGIGMFLWSRRRRQQRELSDARAAVMPYYDRLAGEVNSIDPRDDATARQAMADASERFTSAGGQLAAADSVEKYAQARRTTLEGLYAARTARQALGLDPGPALPPVTDGAGDLLDRPREITVQGQTFQGYPSYTPGAPYFYGGGYGVPGGWYSFPFWETLLIGSVLGGGLGGWGWGGGGFGAGYDTGFTSGYEAGEDAAQDQSADDGGGWGDSGGGGNWDSGWGDGGGGDWGGGGGDFGGGGDSGGGNW